jgi:hypothetical protein
MAFSSGHAHDLRSLGRMRPTLTSPGSMKLELLTSLPLACRSQNVFVAAKLLSSARSRARCNAVNRPPTRAPVLLWLHGGHGDCASARAGSGVPSRVLMRCADLAPVGALMRTTRYEDTHQILVTRMRNEGHRVRAFACSLLSSIPQRPSLALHSPKCATPPQSCLLHTAPAT